MAKEQLEEILEQELKNLGAPLSRRSNTEDMIMSVILSDYERKADYRYLKIVYGRTEDPEIGVETQTIEIREADRQEGLTIRVIEACTGALVIGNYEDTSGEWGVAHLKFQELAESVGEREYLPDQPYARELVNQITDCLREISSY